MNMYTCESFPSKTTPCKWQMVSHRLKSTGGKKRVREFDKEKRATADVEKEQQQVARARLLWRLLNGGVMTPEELVAISATKKNKNMTCEGERENEEVETDARAALLWRLLNGGVLSPVEMVSISVEDKRKSF
eukprot:Lithocolla_globosa_v1_NODE_784_length_3286_cov_30.816042.p2 type:complete len:133 gc:universal NODE_784_length_3286_cov_30.816042:252-650(+)